MAIKNLSDKDFFQLFDSFYEDFTNEKNSKNGSYLEDIFFIPLTRHIKFNEYYKKKYNKYFRPSLNY